MLLVGMLPPEAKSYPRTVTELPTSALVGVTVTVGRRVKTGTVTLPFQVTVPPDWD
jgi:hypothetical protein